MLAPEIPTPVSLVETQPYTPPALSHPDKQLGMLAFLRTLIRNPMETWPRDLFREDRVTNALLGRELEFVMRPDLVEEVLVGQSEIFRKAPIVRRTIAPAVGEESIFTAHGAQWRWQRRAASPSFRNDKILGFVPAFESAAERAVNRLSAHLGGETDISEEMMATTFEVILETMVSGDARFDKKAFGDRITRYFETVPYIAAITVLRLPKWFPYPGKRRSRAENGVLRGQMIEIIANRRANPRPGGAAPDLLDMMIAAEDPEDRRTMTDGELADNLLTFVVAGHETTAIALTWALFLVANAPDVERKLLDEVTSVTADGPITPENADKLVYAKQVVQEAMRLFPPAPLIPRIANEATTLGGVAVPKGKPVYVPVYAIHRHEKLWSRPDVFDPDRFEPERARKIPRGAYLPFGAGPRICIGAAFAYVEAQTILATLIRRLRFTARPGLSPKPVTRLTLRPDGGMPLMVEPR